MTKQKGNPTIEGHILVALYVSTSGQHGASVEAQRIALQDRAATERWSTVGTYEDDTYAGDLLSRPGLDRLRQDARLGSFTHVLVEHPSRLARRFIDLKHILEELHASGVTVWSSDGPLHPSVTDHFLGNGRP